MVKKQLSGAAVLALGIWTVSDRSFMERLLGINLYIASSVSLIITGTVVAFIALLGSLGAYKEVRYMLRTYFIILLGLLVVILAVGLLSFLFRNQLDERLKREMHTSMRLYGNDSHVTEAWDTMQSNVSSVQSYLMELISGDTNRGNQFECCGVAGKNARGYESWRRESSKFNSTEGPLVPESCCRSREDDQVRRACQGRQPRKEDTYFDVSLS